MTGAITAFWAAVILAGTGGLFTLSVTSAQSAPGNGTFEAALAQVEAAQVELARGRPEPYKALWSRGDDVTLSGGLGGAIEKGWAAVSQRLDWVATQYGEGSRSHVEIARVVGQDLAYIVQRETIRFRAAGQTQESTQELRATTVFRLESGAWRIVHRHADSLIARKTAG